MKARHRHKRPTPSFVNGNLINGTPNNTLEELQ
jgi:hypothetical protein